MDSFTDLVTLLLTSIGLTVLIVWPEKGPSAWLREQLRPLLPARTKELLDCYICTGFWVGLALSPVWWAMTRTFWCWFASFMTAGLFWLVLGNPLAGPDEPKDDSNE